jgi:hypothetical protein
MQAWAFVTQKQIEFKGSGFRGFWGSGLWGMGLLVIRF